MSNQKTIAIIGASTGQEILYRKAKEMGLHVIGFAWDKGVLTDSMFDEFYEISVKDIDAIVEICKTRKIDGIVTNASEFLMPLTSEIAERLGLTCTPAQTIRIIQNKDIVRELTKGIEGLGQPKYYIYPDKSFFTYPCVVKPVKGASKKGVSFCNNDEEFTSAIEYAGNDSKILVEEYIQGREFSVETLSYHGKHDIVQITDKQSSGPPHFVELAHHQPSTISGEYKSKIRECVRRILDKVKFQNGATHIEMKLDEITGELYLIEINCRGGGDHISDTLVSLSTNCDYIREIINISLNTYKHREYEDIGYSGICYLCKQNKDILKHFSSPHPEWIIDIQKTEDILSEATSNYDRGGYFIYRSSKPIKIN
ncbi:MAG: ATP-grasp domain-containing protein [Bacteroidales bacterium]|nr:ATP-grasp domain-containing protein [Bacteroidales bacterium]